MKTFIAAGVVSAALLAGACASGRGYVYVRSGPPPIRTEAVLASPGPGYVWIAGFYRYERNNYVWIGGPHDRHAGAPARGPGLRWIPGFPRSGPNHLRLDRRHFRPRPAPPRSKGPPIQT